MAMAAADPSPAAVMTWARAFATLPGHPHAGDARQPVGVGDRPSVHVEIAAESGEQIAVRDESRRHEQRVAGDGTVAVELDAAEAVVLDQDPQRASLGDGDPPSRSCWRSAADSVPAWRDVDEVIGPLADDLGISNCRGRAAQDAELPVSHLEAVTVGAVQTSRAHRSRRPGMSGISSCRPVATSSRRAAMERPVAQRDAEAGIAVAQDLVNAASTIATPYPLDLARARGEQLAGRQAVAGQEPLHVCGGSVARRPGIDHRDPASCPAEHEGRAQTGRTAADHRHVIAGHFHERRVHPRPASDNFRCCFRESVATLSRDERLAGSRDRPRRGRPAPEAAPNAPRRHPDRSSPRTTGISKSTLSRLETGQRKPSLELLLPLAQAHQVPLDELVGAPEVGDPRIRLKPRRRNGRIVFPLTQQSGGVQAWKVDHSARAATSPSFARTRATNGSTCSRATCD